jgi:hypothetical protein
MSGNRAIAAAINRRTTATPSPAVQQQQQRGGRGRGPVSGRGYQNQNQNQYQNQYLQEPEKKVFPKLSVSDAIALTTIRLGRVETFINALPPLEQLQSIGNENGQIMSNGHSLDENMKVVDEAVFKSIVVRLEKLESKLDILDKLELKIKEISNDFYREKEKEGEKVEEGEGEGEGEGEEEKVEEEEEKVEEKVEKVEEKVEKVEKVETEVVEEKKQKKQRKVVSLE